jgi:hypothetical protein
MIIRLLLDNLPKEDRKQLMIAFESHTMSFIRLPDNHYIGVNIQVNHTFEIEEELGVWSYGKIIKT